MCSSDLADAPPLDLTRIAALLPVAMAATVLKLHPATRMLSSPYPVYRIWSVNQRDVTDVPQVNMTQRQSVLISRRGQEVFVREISAADAAFITAIGAGANLKP